MLLQALIEAKLFDRLAEARSDDMEKLHIANETFENIVAFVRKLKKNPTRFAESFYTDETGRFKGFQLQTNLPEIPEISNMFIEFLDHNISGVKETIKARAGRIIDQNTRTISEMRIKLFIDAPPTVIKLTNSYNAWFVKNLADILEKSNYRSSFVHEFTHTLDFRRINPQYLIDRAKRKEVSDIRDRDKYANDPLELNAYYQQAISDFYDQLLKTKTVEEWNAQVGETPQRFAENIVTLYLRPQVKKRLSPENKKRLMKRAATAWEYLKIN
jgi:hypothetical protein